MSPHLQTILAGGDPELGETELAYTVIEGAEWLSDLVLKVPQRLWPWKFETDMNWISSAEFQAWGDEIVEILGSDIDRINRFYTFVKDRPVHSVLANRFQTPEGRHMFRPLMLGHPAFKPCLDAYSILHKALKVTS